MTKKNVTIRPAQPTDAQAMAQLIVDTWLATHRGQVPDEVWQKRRDEWTYEVSERAWRRLLVDLAEGKSEGCVYVALDRGSFIGLSNGHPIAAGLIGEIGSLYIKQSHQGQGLGRQLMAAVATHLAQQGITELRLGVLANNTPAHRFYEAMGGCVIGERESEDYGVKQLELVYSWQPIEELIDK